MGRGTLSAAAGFFHVSPIQLSSAVTFGHPSSVTVNFFSHNSSSSGTLGCIFEGNFCTKLLFYGSVFHSHMPNHLSHFSSVECGSSAYTTPSSHCSVGYALRSNMGRMILFLPIVHGRKDGGCCSTCTLRVSLTFLVEYHVNEPHGPSIVL